MSILSLSLFCALFACKKQTAVLATADDPEIGVRTPSIADLPPEIVRMVNNFERIHYDYDSATLDETSKAALRRNAAIMAEYSDIRVEVQGHCDERGSTEYNIALGDRRAHAVQTLLVAEGISPNRIAVISYGEEKPLVRRADEAAWSQNRRAEFRVTWDENGVAQGTTVQ